MRIEIWAEVTCPWCGLGSHRLDRAVERFEHGDEVEVIHRSLPLSDSFPTGGTISVREALKRKHGLGGAQLEATTRRIEALAEQEGLSPYIVLDNQVGNTGLAHEFLAHASAEGKNRAAWDAVFRAYFGRARPVFGLDALLDLADELGLDREKTRQALTEGRFRQQVRDEAEQARRLGATGAPFIVIDGRYALPGAQDTETLLRALRELWDDSHVAASGGTGEVCGPDGCAVPADHPAHA
ncbi:DsbA family oxidoreductase [Streptomyces sp. SID13726]|uniref:DsbA family oxidoreductase n=1 Tax=Streptomyces sp. SID13726 TaxID=2706058 RepID=UPI0013BCDD0A|nr:DsbA family oxidoreductase [Streptomyces sp. SID13726]NEB03396.1 DsbA family oxidoreductase [Streptomyces sp. SID13726]